MGINPFKAALIVTGFFIAGAHASEGVDDVLRLQRAGLSADVQYAFVKNSSIPYDPTAVELETMERDGVSASVMIAMIDRGREVRAEPAAVQPVTSAQPGEVAAQPYTGPVNQQPVQYAEPTTQDYATVVYAPPAEETNISFFYEAMSPHGKWHQHPQHGWVFQPTVVQAQRDWRPYMDDGRWVWTDQGWYWQSDLEWGWAAFHYGRWARDDQYTWIWVPDTQWGPAWVNWRQSEEYYGWAPLPPQSRFEAGVGFSFHNKNVGIDMNFGLIENDYAFVPSDRFFERDYRRVQLPRDRVRNVYNNTTIVNNTYVYNDNRIINNGIPRDRVERRNNRKIETVRIRDERAESGRPIPRERQSGNEIAVYRPQVKAATPIAPPAAVQRRQEAVQKRQEAAKQDRTENREQAKDNREQNKDQREKVADQRQQAQDTAKQGRTQMRQENESAAKQRLEKEKAARLTDRKENVQARDQAQEKAKTDRQQEAQTRDQAQDKAKADRLKEAQTRDQAQDKAKADRQQEAQTRQQAQDKAQESAKAEREQGAQAREQAAKQRVDQEKAQREQNAAQRATKAEERAPAPAAREQAQDAAKAQRDAAAQAREQTQDAAKAQRDAAAEARQNAQESAKAERKQDAQEKKDDRQEKAQERKDDRQEKAEDRKK